MAKSGRPRGRPRKIRPEEAIPVQSPPISKAVAKNGKKRGRPKKQVETNNQISSAEKTNKALKQEPFVISSTFPDIPESSDQPKKFGKIPISKFKPSVLKPPSFTSSRVPPFEPLTPPPTDISRSGSEVSSIGSVPSAILRSPVETLVSKFQSINAWLAQKQSSWCQKNSVCLKTMLKKESLISTFKCMSQECSYTTTSVRNFQTHIRCHESSLNQLQYLYFCPYCFFNGSSAESLIQHYASFHNHDRYQCGSCFYRSADAHSCWEHCTKFHSRLPPVVYECPLEPSPNNETTKLRLKNKRRQFVAPLFCTSCCLQFFLMDQYEEHFIQHTSCVASDISDTVLDDLREYKSKIANSKIGRFECLFCDYGTNQRGMSMNIFVIMRRRKTIAGDIKNRWCASIMVKRKST